jgi:hypothetical protein
LRLRVFAVAFENRSFKDQLYGLHITRIFSGSLKSKSLCGCCSTLRVFLKSRKPRFATDEHGFPRKGIAVRLKCGLYSVAKILLMGFHGRELQWIRPCFFRVRPWLSFAFYAVDRGLIVEGV